MSDLQKYVENRKKNDSEFAKSYDSGYEEFKIGVILREARRKSGLTQEELARRIRTTKSAISRIENIEELITVIWGLRRRVFEETVESQGNPKELGKHVYRSLVRLITNLKLYQDPDYAVSLDELDAILKPRE